VKKWGGPPDPLPIGHCEKPIKSKDFNKISIKINARGNGILPKY